MLSLGSHALCGTKDSRFCYHSCVSEDWIESVFHIHIWWGLPFGCRMFSLLSPVKTSLKGCADYLNASTKYIKSIKTNSSRVRTQTSTETDTSTSISQRLRDWSLHRYPQGKWLTFAYSFHEPSFHPSLPHQPNQCNNQAPSELVRSNYALAR